jgi:adenine-specific DNA-methyltransferase
LSKKGKLELTWVGKDERVKLEPRVLVEDPSKSYGDPNTENMLIYGDNLLALKALEQDFAGQIKCIYIDPPFNTGSAFEHYDDNLEHSLWLSMMEPRLAILHTLLRSRDGLIFVHIDYRELAYLKILLDGIFGRKNFLSLITVKVKDPAGVGQQSLIFDVCEYILVYAKDFDSFRNSTDIRANEELVIEGPVKGYNKAIVDFGRADLIKTLQRQNMGEVRIFRCRDYKIVRFKARDSFEEYKKHFNTIFADYNPSGGTILQIRDEFPQGELSYMEYVPTKGKNAGKLEKVYFLNRRILAWLKDIAELDENGQITKRTKMTNAWEIPNAQLFSEGGVDFRQSKKPELLVAKILDIASSKGDWVLDSFLGSGTTAAVAHKMGRKWIGIELGEHCDTHCLPRLKRVVSGEDQTGISKEVGWQGGGGFKYYRLAESLLVRDKELSTKNHPVYIINPRYDEKMLIKSICKIENFRYRNEGRLHGISSESRFLHVTTNLLTQVYLDSLAEDLSKHQSLLIYCTRRRRGLVVPDNIEIKKIPRDLLAKCDFEEDKK